MPDSDHDAARAALQLAAAVRAKDADIEPSPDGPQIVQSNSTNLDEDAAELLALARWWPLARLYVSELPTMTHLSTTAKVNDND